MIVATGVELAPQEIPGLMEGWQKVAFDFYTLKGVVNLHKAMREFKGGKLVLNIAEFPFKCPVAPLESVYMADAYFTERAIVGLGGLDKRFDGEALGRMFGQVLISADNIGEGLRLLNRFMSRKTSPLPGT